MKAIVVTVVMTVMKVTMMVMGMNYGATESDGCHSSNDEGGVIMDIGNNSNKSDVDSVNHNGHSGLSDDSNDVIQRLVST